METISCARFSVMSATFGTYMGEVRTMTTTKRAGDDIYLYSIMFELAGRTRTRQSKRELILPGRNDRVVSHYTCYCDHGGCCFPRGIACQLG
jgi:hypothetical protein